MRLKLADEQRKRLLKAGIPPDAIADARCRALRRAVDKSKEQASRSPRPIPTAQRPAAQGKRKAPRKKQEAPQRNQEPPQSKPQRRGFFTWLIATLTGETWCLAAIVVTAAPAACLAESCQGSATAAQSAAGSRQEFEIPAGDGSALSNVPKDASQSSPSPCDCQAAEHAEPSKRRSVSHEADQSSRDSSCVDTDDEHSDLTSLPSADPSVESQVTPGKGSSARPDTRKNNEHTRRPAPPHATAPSQPSAQGGRELVPKNEAEKNSRGSVFWLIGILTSITLAVAGYAMWRIRTPRCLAPVLRDRSSAPPPARDRAREVRQHAFDGNVRSAPHKEDTGRRCLVPGGKGGRPVGLNKTLVPVSCFRDEAPWRTAVATHIGPRSANNDGGMTETVLRCEYNSIEVFDFAAVFDGVGGRLEAGQVAETAMRFSHDSAKAQLEGSKQIDELILVERVMKSASNGLCREARDSDSPHHFRTTAALALVSRRTGRGAIASIGDSEVFIRRSSGPVERLVEPQRGAEPHIVTACLGPEQLGKPQFERFRLHPGDLLLLVTDGVVQPDMGRMTADEAAAAVAFEAARYSGPLSEAVRAVVETNAGIIDVIGIPVFSDNQTIAVIGTGYPPVRVVVPDTDLSYCLSRCASHAATESDD